MPLVVPSGSPASPIEKADGGAGPPSSPQRSGIESETSTVQLSTIELPGAQRAQTSATTPPSPRSTNATSTTPSEQELEELARQLYGRLRTRLRRELLTDRERVGTVVDFR